MNNFLIFFTWKTRKIYDKFEKRQIPILLWLIRVRNMNEEVRWKYSKNRKNIFSEGFACKNLLLFQFWNNKENAWDFIHVQKIFVQKFEQISQIRDNNLTRNKTLWKIEFVNFEEEINERG